MRRERMTAATFLIAVLLAVLISFSAVMCLEDAFQLGCDRILLLGVCAGASVLAAVFMGPRRCWPLLLTGLLTGLVVLIWQRTALVEDVNHFLYRVTGEYALCYSGFRTLGQAGTDSNWLLMVLAVPLAWLTVWVASREGSAVLVIMACLPILVLCLLIVDLAPVLWLILLTGGLLVLLVSHSVRERSPAEGSRLAWWLVLPTIILLSAITVLWPPADYTRADWSSMLQRVAEAKVNLQSWQQTVITSLPSWDRSLKEVDLNGVGPRINTGTPVMDYRSDLQVGYLRGVSLGHYENNRWEAVDSTAYHALKLQGQPLVSAAVGLGTLELQTVTREAQLYTAYDLASIPAEGVPVDDAYVQNRDRVMAYAVSFGQINMAVSALQTWCGMPTGYDGFAATQYLQIPENLQEPLNRFVSENGLTDAYAQEVAAFVRSSGVYDLNTPRVPAGEDFVLYFLEQSHRGYCVHFASACTMLLRSVGIPARYVTGYAVDGAVNQWNTVTDEDAHAWVEYYLNGVGWFPLEATPAAPEPDEVLPEQDVTAPEDETPVPPDDGPTQDYEIPEQQENTPVQPDGTGIGHAGARSWPVELLWLLVLPGLLLLIAVRRWFGLHYRRERCLKGHPNRRALTWWRWLVQLSGVLDLAVPEDLLALAEKARFSQHTVTEEELSSLQQAVEARIAMLKTLPTGKRLWFRYGLVLY